MKHKTDKKLAQARVLSRKDVEHPTDTSYSFGEIETGVPLEDRGSEKINQYVDRLKDMKEGDSFFVKVRPGHTRKSLMGLAYNAAKKVHTPENPCYVRLKSCSKGFRVWKSSY